MFSEPTINDFLDNVRWHLAKAADRAGRAAASTQGLLASKGGLNSGRAHCALLLGAIKASGFITSSPKQRQIIGHSRRAKISFAEMRDSGVRGILIYCADQKPGALGL
jgi:hypothetical protein